MSATLHHIMPATRRQDPDTEAPMPEPGTLLVEDETLRAGFTQIPNRVLRASNLSRDAKILCTFLLSYAGQQGSCFPGYTQLCMDMGASPSIVRKYMGELERCGLLVQKRRGLGKTNLYTLRSLSKATLAPPASPTPRVAETADQECGSLETDDQDRGSLETADQDGLLSAALESNPCSGKEDTIEEDTDEEEFDSKGPAPHGQHGDDGPGRQSAMRPAQGAGRGQAVRPPATPSAISARGGQAPPPVTAAPPVPDDQALVAVLAQLGVEFGDQAARSSLTRVRTLRQRHGLSVDEVTRCLDAAAGRTRGCRTVQPTKRMAYLLTVLENLLAVPPEGPRPAVDHAQQWRGSHPTTLASSDRLGSSRYIGGSYGVCASCLSSPCEGDCPTRIHDTADHAAAETPGAVHGPDITATRYACAGWLAHPLAQRRHDHPKEGLCPGAVSTALSLAFNHG